MKKIFSILMVILMVSCASRSKAELSNCLTSFGRFQSSDSSFTWELELLESGNARYSQKDKTLSKDFKLKCVENRLTINDGYWDFGFPLNRYSTVEIEFEAIDKDQVKVNRYNSIMVLFLFLPIISGDDDKTVIGKRVN